MSLQIPTRRWILISKTRRRTMDTNRYAYTVFIRTNTHTRNPHISRDRGPVRPILQRKKLRYRVEVTCEDHTAINGRARIRLKFMLHQ